MAGLDVPVLVVLGDSGSDLGALGVESNGQGSALELLLGLSSVLNHGGVVLVRAVREVHSDNVETGWVSKTEVRALGPNGQQQVCHTVVKP